MVDIVETVANPANIAAALAAGAAFLAVVTVATPMLASDKLGSRLKAVSERREELRKKSRALLDKSRSLRNEDKGFVADTVKKLNLQNLLNDPNIQNKLMQAGLRGQTPVSVFYFCRFALPFLFAIGAFIYTSTTGVFADQKLLVVAVGAALGFYGPSIYLSNLVSKRRENIMKSFPDALDMLLICVESGHVDRACAASRRFGNRRGFSGAGRRNGADHRRAFLFAGTAHGVRKPCAPHRPSRRQGRGDGADPGREIRHAAGRGSARHGQGKQGAAHFSGRKESGVPAGEADRANDHLLPAGFVCRNHGPGDDPDLRLHEELTASPARLTFFDARVYSVLES